MPDVSMMLLKLLRVHVHCIKISCNKLRGEGLAGCSQLMSVLTAAVFAADVAFVIFDKAPRDVYMYVRTSNA